MKPPPRDTDLTPAERRRLGFEQLAPRLKLFLLDSYSIPWDAADSVPKSANSGTFPKTARSPRRSQSKLRE